MITTSNDKNGKYNIEKVNFEKKELIVKRYNKDTGMEVEIHFIEDETTEKRWENFWRLFEQNEARKIILKQKQKSNF